MVRFYTPNLDEACDALDLYDIDYDLDECHPHNSCLLSLRGIVGADQIAQWDTRYDAKGKKVLDDAE